MSKKKEISLQETITNQDSWNEMLTKEKLYVVDAYCTWCGPCASIVGFFRRIKNDLGDDLLNFACVDVDKVDSLANYRGRCEPNFLFYGSGNLIGAVRGCNAPLLEKTIKKTLHQEHQAQAGDVERTVIEENYKGSEVAGGENRPATVESEQQPGADDDSSEDGAAGGEEVSKEMTVGIIKPDLVSNQQVEEIMDKLEELGLAVLEKIEHVLTEDEVKELYYEHTEESYFGELVEYMTSGPSVVLAMTKQDGTGEGVIELWREAIGPFDAAVAKETHPATLRAMYGTDSSMNGLHGSSSTESAMRELAFFFPDFQTPTYTTTAASAGSKQEDGRLTPDGNPASEGSKKVQRTLALIRPDALKQHKDDILAKIGELGLVVAMEKEVTLNEEQVKSFYHKHVDEPYFEQLCREMTSGPVLALCLTHEFAVDRWKEMLGPPAVDQIKDNPDCLRAQFHVDGAEVNAMHGSESEQAAEEELRAFFELDQTLAVIKPEGYQMRDQIMEKFKEAGMVVSHQQSMKLSKEIASELYKNKEQAPFYNDLIDQMTSGESLMVLLSAEDAVSKLRRMLGPVDPKRARRKCPDTLRANFGFDALKNSIHAASNLEEAESKVKLVFGDVQVDWDGYFKSASRPSSATSKIRRLRDLEERKSEEEEEKEASDDDDKDFEDPGPLALLNQKANEKQDDETTSPSGEQDEPEAAPEASVEAKEEEKEEKKDEAPEEVNKTEDENS